MQEIEKEKQEPGEREKVQRAEEAASILDDTSSKTLIPESDSQISVPGSTQKTDEDVKMES